MLSDPIRYTEPEAALVNRLAQVRVRADAGDRRAKAQIAQMVRQLAVLTKQAKQGNTRAARMAQVLEESGLLVSSQMFVMDGALGGSPWSWKLGGLNALNAALLAASGILLLKKRWVFAAVPVGVLLAHEGRSKRWW